MLLLATILFGQPLSILGLIVASASVLVTGLLIRHGGGHPGRLLGGLLALIGAVSLAGLAAFAVAGPRGY
jgi:type VI protein secretion system component VasK